MFAAERMGEPIHDHGLFQPAASHARSRLERETGSPSRPVDRQRSAQVGRHRPIDRLLRILDESKRFDRGKNSYLQVELNKLVAQDRPNIGALVNEKAASFPELHVAQQRHQRCVLTP